MKQQCENVKQTFETVKRNDSLEFPQILNMYKYTQAYFDKQRKERDGDPTTQNSPNNVEESGTGAGPQKESVARKKGISQYDYQLRGCVIHAGVAGAGHYWSLCRTRSDYNQSLKNFIMR